MKMLHMLQFLSISLNTCIALEIYKELKMVKISLVPLSQCSISIPHISLSCISAEVEGCGSWQEDKDKKVCYLNLTQNIISSVVI